MQEQEPNSCLEFRPSPIHGFGAFAAAPIRAGRLMLEYVGEKITKTESARRCEAGNTFISEHPATAGGLDEFDTSRSDPIRGILIRAVSPHPDALRQAAPVNFRYDKDWFSFAGKRPCPLRRART